MYYVHFPIFYGVLFILKLYHEIYEVFIGKFVNYTIFSYNLNQIKKMNNKIIFEFSKKSKHYIYLKISYPVYVLVFKTIKLRFWSGFCSNKSVYILILVPNPSSIVNTYQYNIYYVVIVKKMCAFISFKFLDIDGNFNIRFKTS